MRTSLDNAAGECCAGVRPVRQSALIGIGAGVREPPLYADLLELEVSRRGIGGKSAPLVGALFFGRLAVG